MRGKKKIFLWGKTKLDIGFYKDLLNLATGNADKVYSLSFASSSSEKVNIFLQVKNPKIKKFGSMAEMFKHAIAMNDKKLLTDIEFLDTYR